MIELCGLQLQSVWTLELKRVESFVYLIHRNIFSKFITPCPDSLNYLDSKPSVVSSCLLVDYSNIVFTYREFQ